MFKNNLVDFKKNKDLHKGGRGKDNEMISKGRRKIHVNYNDGFKEFLSTQELKELIVSLSAAPEGTTLITFRRRASDRKRLLSIGRFITSE